MMPGSSGARPTGEAGVPAGTVEAAGDGELEALLRVRPDLVSVAPRGPRALEEALASPESLRLYHQGANRAVRQAMEALCLVSDPLRAEALAELLACQPADVVAVLARLRTAWVVRDTEAGLVRSAGLRKAFARPGALGPSFRVGLQAQSVGELADTARRLGLTPRISKTVLVEALFVAIPNPATITEVIEAGPPGTAELAQRMAFSPGGSDPDHDFYNSYNSYSNHNALRSPHTPVGWLVSRGLLQPDAGWWSVHMPAEVALVLRGGRLFPEPFVVEPPPVRCGYMDAGAVDHAAAAGALRTAAEISAVAEAWSTEPAKLLQAGGLGVKEVRRVAKLTGRTEADAACLVERAGKAGLVGRDLAELVALPAEDYDRWAGLPAALRAARLARTGMLSGSWINVAGTPDEKGKPIPPLAGGPGAGATASAAVRRAVVLALLGAVPDGQGASVLDLMTRLLWEAPALWEHGPAPEFDLMSWAVQEAADLGVLAIGKGGVAGDGAEPPVLVSLSSFGRAACAAGGLEGFDEELFAAGMAAFCPGVAPEIVLQADLTAVAPGELPLAVRRELELLADVESTGAATVYRFSEASLRRGFDQGRSAAVILSFLAGHSPKGIPQPLSYMVEDVGRRFGEARVGFVRSYVCSEEPGLLAAMVATKRLARLGLRLLAPTVATSDAEPLAVVRGLRYAGYMAAAEDAAGAVIALGVPEAWRLASPPGGRRRPVAQSPGEPVGSLSPEAAVRQLRQAPGEAAGGPPDGRRDGSGARRRPTRAMGRVASRAGAPRAGSLTPAVSRPKTPLTTRVSTTGCPSTSTGSWTWTSTATRTSTGARPPVPRT